MRKVHIEIYKDKQKERDDKSIRLRENFEI